MSTTIQNYKPILYSTEMVQSCLAGRKKQTRRLIGDNLVGLLEFINSKNDENLLKKFIEKNSKYKVGDIIWVRESYGVVGEKIVYKADTCSPKNDRPASGWKPSIHMPKKVARIFHRVVKVRCEKLADISDEDARAEGIEIIPDYYWTDGALNYMYCEERSYHREYFFLDGNYGIGELRDHNGFVASFLSLFAKITSWELVEKNPWVWVYEFEQIEKPEGWPL